MKRNLARTVALTLAIAFLLNMVSTIKVEQAQAAEWKAKSWTFPVIDDWGKSLASGEARGYLYNSTLTDAKGKKHYWGNWTLLATGDVWTNSSGSYITFNNIPNTWNQTHGEITYTLVIKLKISGAETPITIYNATIFTLNENIIGGAAYSDVMAKVDLGSVLQFGYTVTGNTIQPAFPINEDGFTEPQRVWLYYEALKVVDMVGLPLTVTDVKVTYSSNNRNNKTWITQSAISGIIGGKYWSGTANGSYEAPNNGLVPMQGPFRYEADCHVAWVIIRVPRIGWVGQNTDGSSSLVNNMTFLFYYHGTLVGNFSANSLTLPPDDAWGTPFTLPSPPAPFTPSPPRGIDGRVDAAFHSTGPLATLTANVSQFVMVNVNWLYNIPLYDQNGAPWPTRNAKVTLYDTDLDNQYPWPGVISPDSPFAGPSLVWLRYPVVNHTLKVVVTWFDLTVHVSYFDSATPMGGGWILPRDLAEGITVDMVQVWIKLYTSTQVPAPLDPNWVDEVKIRLESRMAPSTTYIAKLTYWHGYIILPDTPFTQAFAQGPGSNEQLWAMGWLPNGSWTTIDFFVKFKGLEVVNTVTGYPYNTTLKLNCPGTPSDYGRTFYLYAGVYDVGFQVLLGSTSDNETAPEGTPLFLTTPDMQRILVTTDGQGSVTLRDVPSGTYRDFVILYKMLPINCTNVKSVLVNVSTKPLIKLLFPAFYLNITVWNFEGTFKLVNLNASFYNTVDYSKFGINNDLLRSALDVDRKRIVILPDDWAVLEPVAVVSPDIGDLIDYLGAHPTAYSTIRYRTQLWITGRDMDGELGDNGVPVWPMQLGLMPAANYSCRISVPNGTEKAIEAGFRPADYNATVYWSEDPFPGVGPIEVSARKATDLTVSVNIYTYIYNVPVQTLDASGQVLKLSDMSAVILAEPFNLELGTDGDLITWGYADMAPWQLWYMQQWDENATTSPFYNAYLVRFNTSDTNWFHSVNATSVSPPTDPDLGGTAHNYPHQSRYLIGMSTLEPTEDNYTFNVYYQGVMVFNDSIPLTNPYTIGTAGHAVTGTHKIKTSVYPFVFEATNDPLDGNTFGIANLKAEVFWAGLNTTWWPTVNLTYRTAPEEFALLNASKLYKGFNMTVVERMWGNVSLTETEQSIVEAKDVPYYSSFLKIVNGTTDSNGEFKVMVPVWNYSVGSFPTYMGTAYANGSWLGDVGSTPSSTLTSPTNARLLVYNPDGLGGPRCPWIEATDTVRMVSRIESLFGTPVFVNYTTIPGKTNNVPVLDDPRLVGVGPGYAPWINGSKAINATGLINPETVPEDELNGVSLTMDVLGVRAYGTGVLVNNNKTKLIYGDFQGRSPELALIGTGPYKEEGNKIAPPQSASNFYAKVDSKTLANDLWVWVDDYAGNALAFQRVEVIRANYTFTRDDEDIVLQPELWSVQYTPRTYPYGPVVVESTPTNILWGFYDVIVRTTNLTDADVVGTEVVTDRAATEIKQLELYGHQWLYETLEGGAVDWESEELHLKWPAKLDVQIKAGDGSTPISKAWVYLIYGTNWVPEGWTPGTSWKDTSEDGGFRYVPPDPDDDPSMGLPAGSINWGVWEIGQNVTAGLTDAVGFAASLKVVSAQGPLATSDGTALNLGFNVYKDVYTVKVYYKFQGEDKLYGPVEGTVVWDTFTDQPQHRYIYLGVDPPATATGEDWSNAQHKIYAVRIWNLKLTIVDQSMAARPIAGAMVTVSGLGTVETASDGSVPFALAPAGTYSMTAKWQSQYNAEEVTIVSPTTIPLQATVDQVIPATVYDAELQLVSPSGKPISGADVSLAGIALGMTGADGKVVAPQVPGKYTEADAAYPVTAMWLGIDVSPGPVTISSSRTYILTATKVATLTVQAVGAQGQGLSAAQVDVTNSAGTTVFSGVANEQGIVNVEVPYDTYTVAVDYKGFTSTTTSTVDSPTPAPSKIATNVFIEVFGQAMTFATFVLWIIVIVIVVLVLAVVIHEYHVWRRKRLPQLFGAPRVPGA